MRSIFSPSLAIGAVSLAVACGGAAPSGDLFGGSTSGSGGDGGGTSIPDGGGSGGGDDASAPAADATAPLKDSAAPPPVKDASQPDTYVPPADPGITCGTKNGTEAFCPVGGACCATAPLGGGAPSYRCASSAGACQGTAIECDDQADCNGQICCGQLANGRYDSVRCAATCDNGAGTQGVRFCDPNAPTDECTAAGLTCGTSTTLPGFHVCK